jgi:4-amino-4-deoxy-L-arabinose transferase-like glycosyltransferase
MQSVAELDLRRDRRAFGFGLTLLGLVVFLTFVIGLDAFVLLDVDEPRFVTATRNMYEGGDAIVPWFNGAERFDKPILVYWLQLIGMWIFGPTEFAARLPSVIAVTLAALSTSGIARCIGLRRDLALLSGLALAASAMPQVMGRAATADALLLGCTTACAWFQWRIATREKASFALHLGVWTTLGLAFLTKGPPALVGPAALGLGLLSERRKLHVRAWLLGFLWALALVLAWAIPALVRSDGRYWTEGVMHHVVERSLRPFEGHGGFAPWWYLFYLAAVPITFLPSSAFLLRLFGRHEGEDPIPRHRALWIWVLGTLLVFTLATSKLPHYPMPAFPALAILAAAACSPRHVHRADRWIAGLFIVLGLAFAGLMIAALPATDQVLEWRGENPPGVSSGVVLSALAFAVTMFAAARHSWFGRPVRSLLTASLASLFGFALLASVVFAKLSPRLVAHQLRESAPRVLLEAEALMGWELVMPSAVFYLHRGCAPLSAWPGASGESRAAVCMDRAPRSLPPRAQTQDADALRWPR